jgi:DNA-binding IclR family transcriptional regulator
MPRPIDRGALGRVLEALENNPKGLYCKEIAERTKIPPSTVWFYLKRLHEQRKIKVARRIGSQKGYVGIIYKAVKRNGK